jgi:hypothetical protein
MADKTITAPESSEVKDRDRFLIELALLGRMLFFIYSLLPQGPCHTGYKIKYCNYFI